MHKVLHGNIKLKTSEMCWKYARKISTLLLKLIQSNIQIEFN